MFNTNGWQTYGLTGAGVSVFTYMFPRKLDPSLAPISTAVGVLGMLGLTAYAGLLVQCAPRAGETVVVSAASGGVGQVVGQFAKMRGCRIVGIAGRPEKCAFVRDELGFDACLSHLYPDFPDQLSTACPDGVDVYFENVGGAVFAAMLPLLNQAARVTLCGLASQYGNMDGDMIAAWQAQAAAVFSARGVTARRLFVGDFVVSHQEQFLADMAGWLKDRRITYREDIRHGLETGPDAFRAMLSGGSFGKAMVQVSADPTRV